MFLAYSLGAYLTTRGLEPMDKVAAAAHAESVYRLLCQRYEQRPHALDVDPATGEPTGKVVYHGPYFFGARPTTLDALVYGHLLAVRPLAMGSGWAAKHAFPGESPPQAPRPPHAPGDPARLHHLPSRPLATPPDLPACIIALHYGCSAGAVLRGVHEAVFRPLPPVGGPADRHWQQPVRGHAGEGVARAWAQALAWALPSSRCESRVQPAAHAWSGDCRWRSMPRRSARSRRA